MQKRQPGPPAGAEIAAEAELDTDKEAVPDIAAQILPSCCDDAFIGREQPHDGLGYKLNKDAYKHAEAGGYCNCVPQCFLRTLRLSRSEILRAERRHRREHRRGHKEQKAYDLFDYADGGGISEPAAVCNDRYDNEGDLNKPVLKRNRHADGQYLTHDAALRAQVAF